MWVLTVVYWVTIFYYTHRPPSPRLPGGIGDKSAHFLAYVGLSFLVGTTLWLASPRLHRRLPLWVLLVGAAYGAFDEITQRFVNRTPDVYDWFADCAGTAVGAGVLWLAQQIDRRRAMTHSAPQAAND